MSKIKMGISVIGLAKTLKCDRCKKKTDCLNYAGKEKVCNDCYTDDDWKKLEAKLKKTKKVKAR